MAQYVYRFGGGVSDGGKGDKVLLGGKGANLAEMASIGLPVPPGFTISTEMCARYYAEGEAFPDSLRGPVDAFFDKVTVNDADPVKREARLNLLARMRAAVHRVADFSRIEG